jgi:iron complex transport system ATP-binding protein
MAIDLDRVGVFREGRWILRDATWQVPRGSLAAIVGPNGSGKSTLARVVSAHLWPTTGRCTVLGQTFGQTSLSDLRKSIRLVQPAGPFDIDASLTARQVVLTGFFSTLNLYETPTIAMTRQATRLLNLVGLKAVADRSYATLSSGERVRSLIARALVVQPRLLLLDEPTAGLDLLAREQILATAAALLRQPTPPTIVLITHHIEEIPPQTRSVVLMSQGATLAAGKLADVLTGEYLSKAYGIRVRVSSMNGRFHVHVRPSAWNRILIAEPKS